MKNKNWSIKVNNLPHKPYTIIDENQQVVCNLLGHLNENHNAKLISTAPKYKSLINSIQAYFAEDDVAIDKKAMKLLLSITKVELEFYEVIK